MKRITVVGAGLSGSEAAWQIAKRKVNVKLIEMRPEKSSKAHKTDLFSELVCSNSFRGASLSNAVGLLKEELKLMGSLIMEAAIYAKVPAGGALAVDRNVFSEFITEKIKSHPLIDIEIKEEKEISLTSKKSPCIIATGPLTSETLSKSILELTGEDNLSFYDAISPVVTYDSLNLDTIFRQSRYNKGDDDYLNIPLTKEQYYSFVDSLIKGEKFIGNLDVESENIKGLKPFEGCMPIEDMAERGVDTLSFGPMKPVGLIDPKTNRTPYAVIQLRQDDKEGKLWNMVGFQTKLTKKEQVKIFKKLPGLKNAEFVRLGSVHRNTFINSPKFLNNTLCFKERVGLFFAGQITGVEGYVESTACGLLAGINASQLINDKPLISMPTSTAIGGLIDYITNREKKDFQPMNINFGLIKKEITKGKIGKKERREKIALNALSEIKSLITHKKI